MNKKNMIFNNSSDNLHKEISLLYKALEREVNDNKDYKEIVSKIKENIYGDGK